MGAVLGYARVSTNDQDLAGQTLRLEQAGAARIFTDKMTGKNFDRPGLAQLLDYARAGDTIAVVRLDRLGRSFRELLQLVDDLKRRDIALHFVEEKIDTASAAGELTLHIFGALAQFERRLISERTRDGLAVARAQGRKVGRQFADVQKVEAALQLVAGEMKPAAAAKVVGLGRSTLYREIAARRVIEEAKAIKAAEAAQAEPPPKPPRKRRGKAAAQPAIV